VPVVEVAVAVAVTLMQTEQEIVYQKTGKLVERKTKAEWGAAFVLTEHEGVIRKVFRLAVLNVQMIFVNLVAPLTSRIEISSRSLGAVVEEVVEAVVEVAEVEVL
jgi:hypothetical protein